MPDARKPWIPVLLAAMGAGAPAAAAPGDAPWPVRPYFEFVHWISMGRPELALQQFTADAVVVAGPACTPEAPCAGLDAIRDAYLPALLQRKAVLPLKVRGFDGITLHTQDGPRACASFDGQVASWQSGHAVTLRGDRIASLRTVWTAVGPGNSCAVRSLSPPAALPAR